MKKNMATAMAAAMAFGTVAPAFASEVTPFALTGDESVSARLAAGLEVVGEGEGTVFKRSEIFNYNGAPEDRTKHTLKSTYADMEILVEKLDSTTPANDLFVLATKSKKTAEVSAAKATLEALKSEIEAYKANGYKVSVDETTTKATIDTHNTYRPGVVTVELTKNLGTNNVDRKVVTFTNVDQLKEENKNDKTLTDELRKSVFGESVLTNEEVNLAVTTAGSVSTTTEATAYARANKLKYLIESNAAKFEIGVDESGEGNKNLTVTLFRKDSDKTDEVNKVKVIEFQNVADVVESAIIEIPQTNDFSSNWAKDEIVDAMLKGQVDASANFRPQASISRAEFAKIVATVIGEKTMDELKEAYIDGTNKETFHDVASDKWYAPVVAFLQTKGIVIGNGDKFNPEAPISRQEVALMVTRAIDNTNEKADEKNVYEVNGTIVHKDVTTKFKDDKEIAIWADNAVKYLNEEAKYDVDGNGPLTTMKPVVEGNQNKFNPTREITRAEALVMVQRAAEVEGRKGLE